MRVRFTESARTQFLEAIAFIRQDRPSAALRFRKRVEQSLRRLQDFPDSGRAIPEFPQLPHREVVITPYRFFYRLAGRTIWIVAVWHGAREGGPPRS